MVTRNSAVVETITLMGRLANEKRWEDVSSLTRKLKEVLDSCARVYPHYTWMLIQNGILCGELPGDAMSRYAQEQEEYLRLFMDPVLHQYRK